MSACELTARIVVAGQLIAGFADARPSAVERSSTFASADSNAASTRHVAAAVQTPVAPDTVHYTQSQSHLRPCAYASIFFFQQTISPPLSSPSCPLLSPSYTFYVILSATGSDFDY